MKERLRQIIDYYNISARNFSLKIGVNESTIRKVLTTNTSIQSNNLAKIAVNYPDINLDWLITGRGQMLFSPQPEPPKSTPTAADPALLAQIDTLHALLTEKDHRIADLQSVIDRLLQHPATPPAATTPFPSQSISHAKPHLASKTTQNHFAPVAEPESK